MDLIAFEKTIIPMYSTSNTTYSANRKVEYIVLHYTAGTTSKKNAARDNAAWFSRTDAEASADFIVDDEMIVQFNGDIKNRYCWAVGGGNYGNKGGRLYGKASNYNCISIEMCSNNSAGKITFPNDARYSLTSNTILNAQRLTEYLMVKYNIDADHVIRHYDVNGKPCPGVIGWNAESGDESKWEMFKKSLNVSEAASTKEEPKSTGTKATEINELGSEKKKAAAILEIVKPIALKYKLFPSVAAAQTILESGYCSTTLALRANNVCGMKCNLSGNTWSGTTWDGKSKYNKNTAEQTASGQEYFVNADFRVYSCVEDSIADRCAYLLGAKNGNFNRYMGITDCKNYSDQIALIKNGGYATDVNYVSKITSIIKKFELDKYDSLIGTVATPVETTPIFYRVQVGAFSIENNALDLQRKLKKAGFDAIIKHDDRYYRVQCGAFTVYDNAEAYAKKIENAGFPTYIKEY